MSKQTKSTFACPDICEYFVWVSFLFFIFAYTLRSISIDDMADMSSLVSFSLWFVIIAVSSNSSNNSDLAAAVATNTDCGVVVLLMATAPSPLYIL